MSIQLTALSGNWTRVIPDHGQMLCVEVGPNMHGHKRADAVEAGDKVCAFGMPNPGSGLEIESAEVV